MHHEFNKKEQDLDIDFNLVNHNEGISPYLREKIKQDMKQWCKNNKKPNGDKYNLYSDG